MTRIVAVDVVDVRFPTSDALDGSDAMHPDPDYSAAYVVLHTDGREADAPSAQGHGLTFTIGRGTEVVCAAIEALLPMVIGIDVDELTSDLGRFARMLGNDSQLRWIGPEKGAIHLATAALVNAAWDLRAKREGKPLWRVLADLSPEALVELVDFTYLTDMITPAAAVDLLREQAPLRADRIAELERDGYPAYTTSAGWLGYDDDKIRARCREAIADGFGAIKMKVGADLEDDMRRAAIVVFPQGEGLAAVEDGGSWGYIHKDGSWAIQPEFTRAFRFSDGLAAVQFGTTGLYGYIDPGGRFTIEPRFTDAEPFSDGRALVGLDSGSWGYIDRGGKVVTASDIKLD